MSATTDAIYAYMNNAGRPKPIGLPDAAGADFPKSQTVASVNGQFGSIWKINSSGGTDDVGAFSLVSGAIQISGILGHAYWFGYNAEHFVGIGGVAGSGPSAGHIVDPKGNGAAGMSCFADAGDTSAGGRHGVEWNAACWAGPDSTLAGNGTNAVEMVAVNDDSNTVNTTIRCGTGNAGSLGSAIYFQNADASKNFMKFDNGSGTISVFQSVNMGGATFTQASAGTSTFQFASTGANVNANFSSASGSAQLSVGTAAAGTATFIISGNNPTTLHAAMYFQHSGVNKWAFEYEDPYLVIGNFVNAGGTPHCYFVPGDTSAGVYKNSETWFLSKLKAWSSVIVGAAALATTATSGFLYLPSMPGTPSGVPIVETGTFPAVWDSTNKKICVYDAGTSTWLKTPALS